MELMADVAEQKAKRRRASAPKKRTGCGTCKSVLLSQLVEYLSDMHRAPMIGFVISAATKQSQLATPAVIRDVYVTDTSTR